jgi:UDP-glucose 4-epimerase
MGHIARISESSLALGNRRAVHGVRALVTGAAGFIGHHLVERLAADGYEVATIDDLSTGDARRVDWLGRTTRFVQGDIRTPDDIDRAIAGCDVVFHQAALASVARSIRDPIASNSVNTGGTIAVMLAAARAGVRRVVFAGSSSIYGRSTELPRREQQRPAPESPYAVSKLAGEQYVHALGALHGIETVVLRYFNIFGPGQDPESEYAAVVPRFITRALRGEPVVVFGDGTQSRDFTFIDNAVAANILAAEVAGVTGLTCNIGAGGRYSLLDLIDVVGRVSGTAIQPRFEAPRAGDIPHSQADISLAATALGYRVLVSFEDGLARTVDWFRGTPAAR